MPVLLVIQGTQAQMEMEQMPVALDLLVMLVQPVIQVLLAPPVPERTQVLLVTQVMLVLQEILVLQVMLVLEQQLAPLVIQVEQVHQVTQEQALLMVIQDQQAIQAILLHLAGLRHFQVVPVVMVELQEMLLMA
jgi:hypothetical protein